MAELQKRKPVKAPEEGELVMGTVTKVMPYGAFVRLDDFPGREGMIHISEIASKWIKNIGEYVNDGDKIVVKVLKIDPEKGHIDLSLKSVKASQKKQVLDLLKTEKRVLRFLEIVAAELKDKEAVGQIKNALDSVEGDAMHTLERISKDGEKVIKETDIPEKWIPVLVKLVKEHIQPPKVHIKGIFEVTCDAPNGVEVIRSAFMGAEKEFGKDAELILKYVGAPNYRVELTAENYKIAERVLEEVTNKITTAVEKEHGAAKLIRE